MGLILAASRPLQTFLTNMEFFGRRVKQWFISSLVGQCLYGLGEATMTAT
jgi:hypothetical protein